MTVFKTFWKIVKKYKGTILTYTIILIAFGGINMSTSDNQTDFSATKPDVLIINNDEEVGITKNLIKYIKDNSNIIDVKDSEEAINDALFYRDVNYIIYIPKNYREDVLNGLNPQINYKSTGDYQASLAEMMLSRYVQLQNIYTNNNYSEDELIENINNNLSNQSIVEMTSKLNTQENSKLALYYNFASYSLMAIVIYIICLVLSSFHEDTVNKRTIISSMNYKKHNQALLFASIVFSIIVWILFTILGRILLGDVLFTSRGLIYIVNSLVFIVSSLTLALFISTLVKDKNAVNGIVNVVSLRFSFSLWCICTSRNVATVSFKYCTYTSNILVHKLK